MKIIFLIAFLSLTLLGSGQNTSISGIVEGAEGQSIRVIAFDDFISKKIIRLDKQKIRDDGSFEMTFEIKETIMGYLDINYQRAEIFLEPGKSYSLEVIYDKDNQLASYYDRKGLQYNFMNDDSTELNHIIWKFNHMYNRFVMENFDRIYKIHDRSSVEDFKQLVFKTFHEQDSGYFTDYIVYKLADIEQYARLKGKDLIAEEYFTGKPILYENVEYTFFFEQYFEKFLITNPAIITISDLIIAVNDHSDNSVIIDALAKEEYLSDQDLRELVLLHGLKSLYYNGTYKKPQVLKMIKEISTKSSNPKHRRIAHNMLGTLTELSVGSPAPDLQLTGIAGQKFKLKNITGKPKLLTFFRSGQEGTANAFNKLSELYNLYNAGLEIISVSMDHDPIEYLELANSGYYYWTFAHHGNDPVVYDLYNIRDLPLYVLIDVEGNIFMFPAPPPGEELERAIMKVIH